LNETVGLLIEKQMPKRSHVSWCKHISTFQHVRVPHI